MHQELRQSMVDLYTCFNEMQGLYEEFDKHSEILKTHHDCMRETYTAFEQVTSWQKHIKEKLHDLPIMDMLQAKTIEVFIETWEGIYDSVEILINEGNKTCDTRWSDAEDFLTYFDLPVLDPISEEPSPKLQLEHVE